MSKLNINGIKIDIRKKTDTTYESWISTNHGLPPNRHKVLCFDAYSKQIFIGHRIDDLWFMSSKLSCPVTHWIELPNPPLI